MDLSQVLTGLESARVAYKELVSEAVAPLRAQLVATVKELGVEGIRWAQYTPHFNDGDECVFGVCTPYLLLPEDATGEPFDEEGIELYSRDWEENPSSYFGKYIRPQLDKLGITKEKWATITAFAASIDNGTLEDVLREAFGDHVQVTVTANGIDVDEYDHD